MEIASIEHKGLRGLAETGSASGVAGNLVQRLIDVLAYLAAIDDAQELLVPPNFGAHMLKGDRAGAWALTVTRNWRMTLRINDGNQIEDMDLEDYR